MVARHSAGLRRADQGPGDALHHRPGLMPLLNDAPAVRSGLWQRIGANAVLTPSANALGGFNVNVAGSLSLTSGWSSATDPAYSAATVVAVVGPNQSTALVQTIQLPDTV